MDVRHWWKHQILQWIRDWVNTQGVFIQQQNLIQLKWSSTYHLIKTEHWKLRIKFWMFYRTKARNSRQWTLKKRFLKKRHLSSIQLNSHTCEHLGERINEDQHKMKISNIVVWCLSQRHWSLIWNQQQRRAWQWSL